MRFSVLILLAFATFATASESERVICEPGEVFQKDCNTCKCSSDGTGAACTRKACYDDTFVNDDWTEEAPSRDDGETRGERHAEEPQIASTAAVPKPVICEPGTNFMRECNMCMCLSDGTEAACTRKSCVPEWFNVEDFMKEETSNNVDETREKRDAEEPKICVPGKITRNYCNTCICSEDGTKLECTNKPCPRGEFEKNGQRSYQNFDIHWARQKRQADGDGTEKVCEPGQVFKKYCNTCRCSDNGKEAACTRMSCPRDAYNVNGTKTRNWRRAIQKFGRVMNFTGSLSCTPGRYFKDYCNDCRCSQNGKSAACTFMVCPDGVFRRDGSRTDASDGPVGTSLRTAVHQYYQPGMTLFVQSVCTPGQTFKNYCNTCQCNLDGRAATCTYMACPLGVYNKDGTRVDGWDRPLEYLPSGTKVTVRSVCTPNQPFRYYCNGCRCSADGTLAVCSYDVCPVGVYNKDGSRIDGLDRPVAYFPTGMTAKFHGACTPGRTFNHYCNTCRCNPDGRSATCTYLACPVGVYNMDGSIIGGMGSVVKYLPQGMTVNLQSVCTPGQYFKYSCNTCRCNADGRSAACTYFACALQRTARDAARVQSLDRPVYQLPRTDRNGPLVCEPGKSFKSFCNTCHCFADGKGAGCTYMECPPGVYNEDGTLVAQPRMALAESKNQICQPSSTFRKACNTCRCSKDGTQAVCTLEFCYE